MKIALFLLKTIRGLFYIGVISFIALFLISIFLPENVENAINIFKNLFQITWHLQINGV